eukprot:756404-Hanusia_phi.AAC.1
MILSKSVIGLSDRPGPGYRGRGTASWHRPARLTAAPPRVTKPASPARADTRGARLPSPGPGRGRAGRRGKGFGNY